MSRRVLGGGIGDSGVRLPGSREACYRGQHRTGRGRRLRSGATHLGGVPGRRQEPGPTQGSPRPARRRGGYRHPNAILLFAGSALLLLLIGCANVSNLLLTRLSTRRHEMVLRSALGASRRALVTQGVAESLLLAAAGGVVGVLLAQWLVVVVSAVEPGNLPQLGNARIDLAATGFALLCATCAAVVGGVAPALRSRGSGTPARDGLERVSTAGIGRDRLRSTLVVLEVAMAVVVLAAAALLMRSMANLEKIDPGFDPAGCADVLRRAAPGALPAAGRD